MMLRLIAISIPVLLGVAAIVWDFKDQQTKKITKVGYIALFLIVISGVVALSLEILEERENQERNEAVLSQTSRSLNRLDELQVLVWFRVPLEQPSLKSYATRVQKELAEDLRKNPVFYSVSLPYVRPHRDTEHIADMALNRLCIEFHFVKEAEPAWEPRPREGDLVYEFQGSVGQPRVGMQLLASGSHLEISVFDVRLDQPIRNNGKILAVPDLAGSTLFVEFCTPGLVLPTGNTLSEDQKNAITMQAKEIIRSFEPIIFYLKLGNGRTLLLDRNKLQRKLTARGTPLFIFRLPDTREQVESLFQ